MILHKSHHKSTIFKTITNDITGLNTGISIFNSSLTTMKGGATTAQAWKNNMNGCSVAGKQYVLTARKAGKSTEDMVNGLKEVPKATSLASVGLKALSIAGNMLLYMAIIKGIQWITTYNQRLEESRQEMIEAGKEASKLTKDLDGLVEQYRKLGEDGKLDNSDREQARSIQEQINSLLGDEVHYIDLSNGSYEHQLELLRKIQHEKANEKYATIKDAKEAAEISLRSKISNVGVGNNIAKSEMEAIEKLSRLPEMDKYLKTYEGDDKGRGKFAMFNVDVSSTEAMVTSYEKMIELRNILSKSYADEIKKGGSLEDFYNNLTNEIDDLSDAVQQYKDAIDDYNINEAVIQFNEVDFGGVKGALIDTKEEIESWAKAMVESDDISDGIKENLIGLAKTYYPELSDAINESVQAHYKEKYAKAGSSSEIGNHIKNLDAEADQCGLTKKAYIELISQEILFNNNNLNVTQKISALQQLAYQAGITADKMRQALMFDSLQKAYDVETHGIEAAYRAGRITKEQRDARKAQILSELNSSLYEGYEDSPGGDTPPYTPSGGDKGSDKNKPDYEDTTDAIINRINLRAKELEQQEEQIENAIEIAELEKDYEKQITLTNDLIATRKKRVEELKTANAGLHNEAEYLRNSNPWDEESWFDSQGNATEAYYKLFNSSSKEVQETINNLFEQISKYKKAYMDNAEEIAGLNKEILQDEENLWDIRRQIFDERMELSEDYIEHSKDFGWENGDNEIAARKRVLDWIQSDYYRSLIKDDKEYYDILNENRKAYLDAQKDEFNKATDFGSSYYDSKKTLLQSYFDVTNSIAEAQHEINKELETSKTMYEWLDEDTRKLLFNQEDYNVLCKELIDIQSEGDRLQRQYEYDLENSTLDTIEEITSNYEMQYDLLMKSYEIAKADLEIAKKKQKLNNVLNERKVRMFINGQWQWVANTQDVIDAKSELADAEYARKTAVIEQRQTESLNELTAKQDKLGTVISEFESGVIDLDNACYKITEIFGTLPSAIQTAISRISTISVGGTSGSLFGGANLSSSFSGGSSGVSGTGNMSVLDATYLGITASPGDTVDVGGKKYKITKNADGNKNHPTGLGLVGEEESELLITSNGHLIPINNPSLFNMQGGEMVFNQDQMTNLRSLWDLSNLNFHHSLPTIMERNQSVSTVDNSIHIGGITIPEQGNENWINGLRRFVSTH